MAQNLAPETLFAPNRDAALQQYRSRASIYDWELLLAEPIRQLTVSRLGLHRGDTVIDVGCGTGLSFNMLEGLVGRHGRILGIEQSAEMLERAQERIRRHRWRNITLCNSAVEDAVIPPSWDAALFHFTHDVMRTPRAIENVANALKPGGRVAAAGLKWAPPWAMPVNAAVLFAALRSVTALAGLEAPWDYLSRFTSDLKIENLLGGGVYIASGCIKPR